MFRVYQVLNVVFLRMFEENLRVINKALSKKNFFSFIVREILAVFFIVTSKRTWRNTIQKKQVLKERKEMRDVEKCYSSALILKE